MENNEKLSLQTYPSPILSQRMPEVTEIDDELRDKVDQMFEIMYANKGIGLAANQANWKARVVVMNLSGDREQEDEELVLINPEVTKWGKVTYIDEEGCLSFPQVKAEVERKETLTFKATDLEGRDMVYQASELFARCLQHELDHLNGIVFVDRLTPVQKAEVSDQLKALQKAYQEHNS